MIDIFNPAWLATFGTAITGILVALGIEAHVAESIRVVALGVAGLVVAVYSFSHHKTIQVKEQAAHDLAIAKVNASVTAQAASAAMPGVLASLGLVVPPAPGNNVGAPSAPAAGVPAPAAPPAG